MQTLVEIIHEHAKDWPANITGIDIRRVVLDMEMSLLPRGFQPSLYLLISLFEVLKATIAPDGTTWYEIAHFALYPRGEKYMRSFRSGKKI